MAQSYVFNGILGLLNSGYCIHLEMGVELYFISENIRIEAVYFLPLNFKDLNCL
jgi:hypothetical protein